MDTSSENADPDVTRGRTNGHAGHARAAGPAKRAWPVRRGTGRSSTAGHARGGMLATAAAVAAYAWIGGGLRPFTAPAAVSTSLGALAVVLVAVSAQRPSPTQVGGRAPAARTAWGVWLAATTAWELWAWASQPRSDHPTLSSLTDDLLAGHPARSAALAVWLVLGAWLARR